ncbi:uncharacterized protein B0T23DRAFT_177136 [Neurospora hispaniola]|uniref:Uncharacterized protein n=1 Tax=Neurospora hispaniola TaxID=588809 RepID=A0AAJ0I6P5_9PEZI|nr:hypothetical protein B0T23DRAFT_177136 [Neurospora hispaniola]
MDSTRGSRRVKNETKSCPRAEQSHIGSTRPRGLERESQEGLRGDRGKRWKGVKQKRGYCQHCQQAHHRETRSMCGKETTDNRGMSLIPGGLAGGRKWFLRNPPSLYGMKHRSHFPLARLTAPILEAGGEGASRFVCFASTQALIVDKVAFSPTISRLVFGPVPPN